MNTVDMNQYYDNGWYSMPVPPVSTHLWTQGDWIGYINRDGVWQKPDLKTRYRQALAAYKEGIYDAVQCAKQFDVSPVVMSAGVEHFRHAL